MKFIAPKQTSSFYNCKRVPRKFKKKHKLLLNKYKCLTLNEKLWMILGETNKEYKAFLIKTICNEK